MIRCKFCASFKKRCLNPYFYEKTWIYNVKHAKESKRKSKMHREGARVNSNFWENTLKKLGMGRKSQ